MATLTSSKTGKTYPDLLVFLDDQAKMQAECNHENIELHSVKTRRAWHYGLVCNDCNKVVKSWKEIKA